MGVFEFRYRLIEDYQRFSRSFTQIRVEEVRDASEAAYVLDAADVHGGDYPSETFRVLRPNRFGKYRTARLVLEAWDRLAGVRGAA